jgi:predicted small metal-binding protein
MKGLGCADLGVKCSFIARGKTAEQVKKLLFDHAIRRHEGALGSRSGMLERMDELLALQSLPLPASYGNLPMERLNPEKLVCENACIRRCKAFIPVNKRPGNEFALTE